MQVATALRLYLSHIHVDAIYALDDETKAFGGHDYGKRISWIAHTCLPGLHSIIEVRGMLPTQTSGIALLSRTSVMALNMSAEPEESSTALIDDQRMSFTRTADDQLESGAIGLQDIQGNVAETLQDCFAREYFDAPCYGSTRQIAACKERALGGGS